MNKKDILQNWLSTKYPNITKEIVNELCDWIRDYEYDFYESNGKLSWIDLQQKNEPVIYFNQDDFIKYWIDTIYPKMFSADIEVGDGWFEFVVELSKLYYGDKLTKDRFKRWLEVTEDYKDWELE